MSIEQTLAVSISGLNANAKKVNAAANNIVNQNTAGYQAVRAETVSRTTSQHFTGG